MKNMFLFICCVLAGIVFFLLTTFVPNIFMKVVEITNNGAELMVEGKKVLVMLSFLGFSMFIFGHIFHALNKRVAKVISKFFDFLD